MFEIGQRKKSVLNSKRLKKTHTAHILIHPIDAISVEVSVGKRIHVSYSTYVIRSHRFLTQHLDSATAYEVIIIQVFRTENNTIRSFKLAPREKKKVTAWYMIFLKYLKKFSLCLSFSLSYTHTALTGIWNTSG